MVQRALYECKDNDFWRDFKIFFGLFHVIHRISHNSFWGQKKCVSLQRQKDKTRELLANLTLNF